MRQQKLLKECLKYCEDASLIWEYLDDDMENLIEGGLTNQISEKIREDLKKGLSVNNQVFKYKVVAKALGSDDMDDPAKPFKLDSRLDIIGGKAYGNGHFILLIETAHKLLKKIKEEFSYSDSLHGDNGLSEIKYSFDLLDNAEKIVESKDEQQIFDREVWEESFNEIVLKFAKESRYCCNGERAWANDDYHSGVFGMERLALENKTYLKDYVKYVRDSKKDYEPFQSEFCEKAIEIYGWSLETLELITSRIYSCAGQCGQDQFKEFLSEGLGEYLKDGDNRYQFILLLLEELILYQNDFRNDLVLSEKNYIEEIFNFFNGIYLDQILSKQELKIFKNNIKYRYIAEKAIEDILRGNGYFDDDPSERLGDLADEYTNVDGLMENCVDQNTEDLITSFSEKDEDIVYGRNTRVVTYVYRAILHDHGISQDQLALKEAEIKVSKYLKKYVEGFADIDTKTYELSTFDYWEIEEFRLKDTLGDLAIVKKLSKTKRLILNTASPTEFSEQNQLYILKNLPTFLRELKISYSFTPELTQTLFNGAKLSSLELLDLSEARNLQDEYFTDKEIYLPNLKELNLDRRKLSSKALLPILESLTPFSLKILKLNQNEMGIAGAELLGKSKKLTKLEELYLDYNGIQDRGLIAILYGDFKHLKKLSIKGKGITTAAFNEVMKCKFTQTLTSLTISSGVDEEAIRAFFPNLEEIEMVQ